MSPTFFLTRNGDERSFSIVVAEVSMRLKQNEILMALAALRNASFNPFGDDKAVEALERALQDSLTDENRTKWFAYVFGNK